MKPSNMKSGNIKSGNIKSGKKLNKKQFAIAFILTCIILTSVVVIAGYFILQPNRAPSGAQNALLEANPPLEMGDLAEDPGAALSPFDALPGSSPAALDEILWEGISLQEISLEEMHQQLAQSIPNFPQPDIWDESVHVVLYLNEEAATNGAHLRNGPSLAGYSVIEILWDNAQLVYLHFFSPDPDQPDLYWLHVLSPSGVEGYISSQQIYAREATRLEASPDS